MVKKKLLCGNIQKSVIYQRNLKLRKTFQSLKNWQTSFIQSWLKKRKKESTAFVKYKVLHIKILKKKLKYLSGLKIR